MCYRFNQLSKKKSPLFSCALDFAQLIALDPGFLKSLIITPNNQIPLDPSYSADKAPKLGGISHPPPIQLCHFVRVRVSVKKLFYFSLIMVMR